MASDPVAGQAARRNRRQSPEQGAKWDVLNAIWRVLRHPVLTAIVLLIALLLVVAAQTLPQLPGQLVDEPATAARHLIALSSEFGTLGDLYRGLGLFDVTHSLLLRLTLALLALIAFVHLGHHLAIARQMRDLPARVRAAPPHPEDPLPLPAPQAVARRRVMVEQSPEQNAETLAAGLAHRFDTVDRYDLDAVEIRFTARRHPRAALLRPLAAIGVLLALAGTWTGTTFGWNVSTGLLAPGATYRSAGRDVQIDYGVVRSAAGNPADAAPTLAIRVGDQRTEQVITGSRTFLFGQGAVTVATGAPGVQIAAEDGAPVLQRAGESIPSMEIGLIFPTPGSEESILLPRYATGIRIVRMPSDDEVQYSVEVYRSDSLGAATREVISGHGEHQITLPNGPALRFRFMPAIEVNIHAFPGRIAVGLGLILALLGAPAFFRKPAYLILQLSPWHADYTLLIAHASTHAEIEAAMQLVTTQTPQEDTSAPPVTPATTTAAP